MDAELRTLQNKKAELQGKLAGAEKALASATEQNEQDRLLSEVEDTENTLLYIETEIGLRKREIEQLTKELQKIIIIF